MQSMTPTTAGRSAGNAATSQGDEITVIASSVAPSEKKGQKAESSFSKSTGFSAQQSATKDSKTPADTNQESATVHASHPLPHNLHNLGQAPLANQAGNQQGSPEQAQLPAGFDTATASHSTTPFSQTLGPQTLGQAVGGTSPQALGEVLDNVPGIETTAKLNGLATASLSRQHSGVQLPVTSSGQSGTVAMATTALPQQVNGDISLSTAFTSKLSEVLASKPDQLGISALNGSATDLNNPAISQPPSQPSQAAPAKAVWANVQMDASQGKWGEQMLQVLQDRVSLQATQNLQEARIRLDPPDLGKLDLVVRVDGDRLNVQINANHAAVRDALVQVSERLRAELQQQQFVHVDVNVGNGDQGQASHSQAQEDESYQPVIFGANDNPDDSTDTPSEHWLSTTA